jgi:hypothetical protein
MFVKMRRAMTSLVKRVLKIFGGLIEMRTISPIWERAGRVASPLPYARSSGFVCG